MNFQDWCVEKGARVVDTHINLPKQHARVLGQQPEFALSSPRTEERATHTGEPTTEHAGTGYEKI